MRDCFVDVFGVVVFAPKGNTPLRGENTYLRDGFNATTFISEIYHTASHFFGLSSANSR